MSMELLEKLCQTPGIPGREERVRALVKKELESLADEVRVDARGNVIGIKRATTGDANDRKKVMLAGHMDEIGFLVRYIDDKGFLRLRPVGGFDPRNLVAQRVRVHGRTDLKGILMPGIKPPHLQAKGETQKTPNVEEFFVDLGMTKEAVEEVVRLGDFVTMDRDFLEIGDQVTTKALDDRVGIYVMLEALRALGDHEVDIYAVGSVEEEGFGGVIGSAYDINPDLGVALDVTIAADIPGTPSENHITTLGEGTAIKIVDSSHISNYKVVDYLRKVAEDNGIKYQMELLPRGGTDAGSMTRVRSGVPVTTISIPTRFVHSPVETANKADIQASVDLLARFLEVAHQGDFSY